MQKSCRWCGKIVPYDHDCTKRPRHEGKRTEEEQGRYTNEWRHKSIEIKERSQYLCAVCKDNNRYVYDNLEVHHITPLRDRPDLLTEDSNLICLCGRHHEQAERGEIDVEYLHGLVQNRDNPPSSRSA